MAKITVHAALGPSPRKQFLQDWHIAYVNGNLDFLSDNITDDITLQIVGQMTTAGKEAFIDAMRERMESPVAELVIHEIITHGREAAVNGEIHYEDGHVDAFCEVYAFKNTKANTLKTITSYVIRV